MTTRRVFLGGGAALALTACARKEQEPTPELNAARALIKAAPSVDLHAHPGRTFVRDAKKLSPALTAYAAAGHFERKAIEDMRTGGLTAAVFAAVSDFQILDVSDGGLKARRQFDAGEAWASFKKQIANFDRMFEDGGAVRILSAEDVEKTKASGKVGAIVGVEGGDFLEGSAERVAEAFALGVRVINPLHYNTNEIGDIITESPTHGGLTEAGRRIVQAMNREGVVIDLAHASERTAFDVLNASDRPTICSHVHIRTAASDVPRFIGIELAREIAAADGVVGAWPAGFGIQDLDGFVDRIFELFDAVGVDHVGLGTDMDANYKPVWKNYREFPEIVAKMMARGLANDDIAKIIGGNGLRVWRANEKQ